MKNYSILLALVCLVTGSSLVSAATETATLSASDGVALDLFGSAVAIDGSYAIANGGGSSYIYEYNGSSWLEAALITPASAPSSVAISGDTAVIGSYFCTPVLPQIQREAELSNAYIQLVDD